MKTKSKKSDPHRQMAKRIIGAVRSREKERKQKVNWYRTPEGRAYAKAYREKNRDKIRLYHKRWLQGKTRIAMAASSRRNWEAKIASFGLECATKVIAALASA